MVSKRSRVGEFSLDKPEFSRSHPTQESDRLSLELENLIRYFMHMALISGIRDDFHVMSEAWMIVARVLLSVHMPFAFNTSIRYTEDGTVELTKMFKAVVVAACALAVDVSGDFEASFAHSAVAWATLFVEQIDGSGSTSSAKANCVQLMRMKMITGRALRWNIGSNNPAQAYCRILRRLRDKQCCQFCISLSSILSRQHASILQAISFLMAPLESSSDTIASTTIVYIHERSERTVPTPMNKRLRIPPSCATDLSTESVTNCLSYLESHKEYLESLITAIFDPPSQHVKTLATIEKEYFQESASTTDALSPAALN